MSAAGGLCIVLLAAGRGRRFHAAGGQGDKLGQRLPDGRTVAIAAAQALRAAWSGVGLRGRADDGPDGGPHGGPVVRRWLAVVPPLASAVDRAAAQALRQALADTGWELVEAHDADAGMGRSLAAGVRAAPQAGGWLVALADMPYLQAATLSRIAAQPLEPAGIVAPSYRGRRGHPVRFGAAYGEALRALQGDVGARDVLLRHADALRLLEVDDPGVLRDVDTPADLGTP